MLDDDTLCTVHYGMHVFKWFLYSYMCTNTIFILVNSIIATLSSRNSSQVFMSKNMISSFNPIMPVLLLHTFYSLQFYVLLFFYWTYFYLPETGCSMMTKFIINHDHH